VIAHVRCIEHPSYITLRGFAPRHASAKASAMSAVALAKAELPYRLSRAPLRRRAPFAWLTSLRSLASLFPSHRSK
jgi:hypothetical protein